MILITGGSGSGKSAFAEKLAVSHTQPGQRMTYLATMESGGKEALERIERHRKQRAGLGFETVECPRDIAEAVDRCHETVLIEDLGNLLANEMFGERRRGGRGPGCIMKPGSEKPETESWKQMPDPADRIYAQLCIFDDHCEALIAVTDEIFSDGGDYDRETVRYMEMLGRLNSLAAQRSDEVWEAVCGIPVRRK